MNPGPSSHAGGASQPEGGVAPRIIKRYVNRKLYDTVESRYVTLGEIAHAIKTGDEVQIVDERTRRDLTSVTLVQIILEEEKRASSTSPRVLCDLIRKVGGQARETVETLRACTEQRLHAVLQRGQLASDRAKEMVAASQEAVLQLQGEMNERVGAAFEVVATLGKLKRELSHTSRRIEDLKERLRGLRGEPVADDPREAEARKLVS